MYNKGTFNCDAESSGRSATHIAIYSIERKVMDFKMGSIGLRTWGRG